APVGADAAVDGTSDLGGPGEGDRGDPLVAGNRRAGLAVALDECDRAGRQTTGEQGLDEALSHQRGDLGRLEQHRVAGGERGPELAGGDVEREVPRRDRTDDPDRFTHGADGGGARPREGRTGGAQRLT